MADELWAAIAEQYKGAAVIAPGMPLLVDVIEGLRVRAESAERENAILREEVEVGIAKHLRMWNTLHEQSVVHKEREKMLQSAAESSAKHVANIKVLGKKLDGVRQELTARAEAAERRAESAEAALREELERHATTKPYVSGERASRCAECGKWFPCETNIRLTARLSPVSEEEGQ